jgi:RHS repeat-associated protein
VECPRCGLEGNRRHTYQDPVNASITETDNYDGMGNLTSVIDRKGQTTQIVYDGINRPTLITFQDNSTIAITWDGGNRATQYVDSLNGTITRSFDGLDRLTQEVTPQGTVNYTYDKASRRATMTVVGQPQVVYTFDTANRLTAITQGANSVGLAYDDANRISTVTWPNGVVGTYSLDNANQLTGISFAKGANLIGTLGYGYDLAGRRTSVSGTLAAFAPPTVSPVNGYDLANRLTSRLGSTLAYDKDGNLTGMGGTTYTWNARNQLVATSAGNASFQYDALGRRVSATVNGVTTGYQYDDLNPVVLGGSFMLAGLGLDENFARVSSGSATSLLTDGLGSTVALSNASAATTATYGYSPYGETAKSGTDATPLEYTGRENDGATGLYYYRARYYSPALGRFISEDPVGLRAGPNFYAYLAGSPTNATDPNGECPWCVGAAIGGGLDLALQLISNGGNVGCVDWWEVGGAAAFGALTGGVGSGTQAVSTGTNAVYQAFGSSGEVIYVGITNNMERRAAEQIVERGISIQAIDGLENLARADARAVEQVLIERYGLENLLNKINSISTTNPIYEQAIQRGTQILQTVGYAGF